METPIIILGGGGHAKVLINILLLQNRKIIGIVDPNYQNYSKDVLGINFIGNDESVLKYSSPEVRLVNAIGSTKNTDLRSKIFAHFKQLNYSFLTIIHPSSIIAQDVKLSEGVQVMAGAIIQPSCQIGANTIINTKASIDHDCYIGDYVHIAPGVTISGGVCVGDRTHIGTGATIIQNIKIGENSLVGAGALVIKDVEDNSQVWGVPAK